MSAPTTTTTASSRRAACPLTPRAGRADGLLADAGQATIELLALVPLLAAITLALIALLAGRGAKEAADQAAVAAAVAQLQGRDAEQAAKAASPGWTHPRVRIARGRATVRLRPRVPRFVAAQIDAERTVVFDPGATR